MDRERPIILSLIDACLWLIELPLPFAAALAVYGAVPGSHWAQEVAQDATPFLIVVLLIGAISIILSALIGRYLSYLPILSIIVLTGALYPSMSNGKKLLASYASDIVKPVPTGEESKADSRLLYANALVGTVKPSLVKEAAQSSSTNLVTLTGVTETWLHEANLNESLPHAIEYPSNDDNGLAVYSKCPLSEVGKLNEPHVGPQTLTVTVSCEGLPPYTLFLTQFLPPLDQLNFDKNRERLAKLADQVNQTPGTIFITGEFYSSSFSNVFHDFARAARLKDAADGFGLIRSSQSTEPKHWLMVDHLLYRGPVVPVKGESLPSVSVVRPAAAYSFSVLQR